jgi:hypothetical protein
VLLVFPLVILFLIAFIGAGIDAILHPRRHIHRLFPGGELLRKWDEDGARFAGLLFSCTSAWMLYEFLRSVCSR